MAINVENGSKDIYMFIDFKDGENNGMFVYWYKKILHSLEWGIPQGINISDRTFWGKIPTSIHKFP